MWPFYVVIDGIPRAAIFPFTHYMRERAAAARRSGYQYGRDLLRSEGGPTNGPPSGGAR